MVAAADVARPRASCPRCGVRILAEPIRVVSSTDSGLRDALLSGRLNVFECTACGAPVRIVAPLLFHDPEASAALVYLLDGLSSSHEEQQRTIGSLTNSALQGLAEGSPRGHLLHPTIFLTEDSFHEAVLVASGVPKESLERARQLTSLAERLAGIDDDAALIEALCESPHSSDPMLIQVCLELAERSIGKADQVQADRMLSLAKRLREHIEPPKIELDAVLEALETARNEDRLEELVQQIRPVLDYTFFVTLTERIEANAERNGQQASVNLVELRGALTAAIDAVDAFERRWADSSGLWIEHLVAARNQERGAQIRMMAFSGLLDPMFYSVLRGLRDAVSDSESEREANLESVDTLAREALEKVLELQRSFDHPSSASVNASGTPS